MIDPHVHLRDWNQHHKETISHGLSVACRAGLDAVFEMPNTDPPIISTKLAEARIALADAAGVPVFHGLFTGLTAEPDQVREMVTAYQRLFPRIVGLKLFAGRSTGNLSVIDETEQQLVWQTLADAGYRGVVAVHCEKEALFQPRLWDPQQLQTHCLARPPASETVSVRDMLRQAAAAGFKGTLHVCHVSVPETVRVIEQHRAQAGFRITCGITPHHALLCSADMQQSAWLKLNPPLREAGLQQELLQQLLQGRIDWIETDHAPHALSDKPLASGIPGLPFLPRFIRQLRKMGMASALLEKATHNNICEVFGIEIRHTNREPVYDLAAEYPFDPFSIRSPD